MSREGLIRLVRSPIPNRRLALPRALAQSDGTWLVTFAELPPYIGDDRPFTTARLWEGVLQGDCWLHLAPIPNPENMQFVRLDASRLVRSGASVAWAVRTIDRGIVVFERTDSGKWSQQVVPARATYPELGWSKQHGLLLILVHPDPNLLADRSSLFLWTRSPTWQILRKIAPSERGDTHLPRLIVAHGLAELMWQADADNVRREARFATINGDGVLADREVVADSSVLFMDPSSPVVVPNGPTIWVMDHVDIATGRREIRMLQFTGGRFVRLAAFANPYLMSTPVENCTKAAAEKCTLQSALE